MIYAAEGRVWKRSLTADAPGEVPIQLVVDREVARPLLLRRVRLLDFSSGAFGPEVSMFVDGGRIRWIDSVSDREVPVETQVLDADGRYAIPGLLDFHNHAGFLPTVGLEANETAHVAYGVTTVRVPGGEVGWVAALAERSSLTSSPIPRYVYAGDFLLGRPMGYSERSLWLRSEDQVRSSIQHNKDAGASFIKVYYSLPWPLQLVAAHEARRARLPIAAHSMRMQEVLRGVTLGYTYLEHLEPNSRFHGDVQQLLAISGTYWTPTLSIMGGTRVLFMEDPERSTDAKFCAFFPRSCRRDDEGLGPQLDSPRGRLFRMLQTNEFGTLREARAHGVNVLVGTDHYDVPGFYIHIEMESFVLAGFTPLEVLELSTRRAALALGVAQDIGTLVPGDYSLTVTDNNSYVISRTITIEEPADTICYINPEFEVEIADLVLDFRNLTTGVNNSYFWSFGDGYLSNLFERAEAAELPGPALVIVGSVVELSDTLNWYKNYEAEKHTMSLSASADL